MKKAAEIYEKNPAVEGLLLLNHGHFAFGETAKKSYQKIIEHTNQVANIQIKNPTSIELGIILKISIFFLF